MRGMHEEMVSFHRHLKAHGVGRQLLSIVMPDVPLFYNPQAEAQLGQNDHKVTSAPHCGRPCSVTEQRTILTGIEPRSARSLVW